MYTFFSTFFLINSRNNIIKLENDSVRVNTITRVRVFNIQLALKIKREQLRGERQQILSSQQAKAQHNKWQTCDMYLHKINGCAHPYEKLANILSYSLYLAPCDVYFPRDFRQVFWQLVVLLSLDRILISNLNLKRFPFTFW